jgi:hypothetical protein
VTQTLRLLLTIVNGPTRTGSVAHLRPTTGTKQTDEQQNAGRAGAMPAPPERSEPSSCRALRTQDIQGLLDVLPLGDLPHT